MALALDISSIITVREVSVVQSIDAVALQALLSRLLSQQTQAEDQLRQQGEEIELLKSQLPAKPPVNNPVKDGQQPLEVGLGTLAKQESDHHTQVPGETANSQLQRELQHLSSRLARLEQQQPTAALSQHTPAAAASTLQPPNTAAFEGPVASVNAGNSSATDATTAALTSQQQQLEKQVAALQSSLAGTADDLRQQLAAGLASKADTAALQGIQQLLLTKADQSDADQLKVRVGDKADRTELDALLQGLVGAAAPADAAAADAGTGATSSGGQEGAAGASAAELRGLKLQLALMQDRLANKADTSAVADAAAGLAAAKQDLATVKLNMAQLSSQLDDLTSALAAVRDAQRAAAQSATDADAAPAILPAVAPTSITPFTAESAGAGFVDADSIRKLQVELQKLVGRLSAVETAVSAAPVTIAPQATSTAGSATARSMSRNSSRNRSAKDTALGQGATAAPAPPAPADDGKALQQLAADVADLRSQLVQLKQSLADISHSRSFGRADRAAEPEAHALIAGNLVPTADNHHSSEDQQSSATKRAAAADSDAGDSVLDDVQSDATAALLEDLSARVAGLQALVDGMAASKADRGEVVRVQAMLADTATQSDADMLRHKLDAQQQQLARLQSLTQRLAGSTPGTAAGAAADGSSSAKLAKTAQAASWEASLASPGASGPKPQGTEWGQNRSGPGAADSLMSETAPDFSLAGGAEPVGSSLDAEQLLSGLEQLAQAVCLLATGQAAAAAAGGDSFSFKHGVGPSGDKPSDRSTGSAGDAGGQGSGNQAGGFGPQMSRLRRLLQTGQVGRKLDWFDPTLLQKMAQRLAAAEALIKNTHSNAGLGGSGNTADLEAKLKKLAADVRLLKERMGDMKPAVTQGGWRTGEGDHTMLSSKPLAGYRCMACDRPLGSLDPTPGPYLPSGQMPLPVNVELAAPGPAAPPGRLPPARSGSSRRNTAQDVLAGMDPTSPDVPGTGRRVTGPQNWYVSAHGPPAEQLPKADVGPHLPPGGWRGSAPRADDGTVLPALGSRGGANSPVPMGRGV